MRPGKIVVSGSVAYDYLMRFPGRFVETVVPDKMHRLSVSFLVDEMRRVKGGVAPNIAYSLALLGADAAVLATAGPDAADYRAWLESEGVDVSGLRILTDVFTASFFVSTDQDQNQIATFFAGAMARAGSLKVLDVFRKEEVALVVVAPNDPEAMRQRAAECRVRGIPFVYDPSQQVARLSGEDLLAGLAGAEMLVANEYEFSVMERRTDLTEADIVARVPVCVKTRGEEGAVIFLRAGAPGAETGARVVTVPVARLRGDPVDPTGVGDAFRAGLLAARALDLPWEIAGRVGNLAAALCLESPDPQPARYTRPEFLERYRESFPDGDADRLAARLPA